MGSKIMVEIESNLEMEQLFIVLVYANLAGVLEDAEHIIKKSKKELDLGETMLKILKSKIRLSIGDVPYKLKMDMLNMFIENATIIDNPISAYGARGLSKWDINYKHPVFIEAIQIALRLHRKHKSINGLLEINGNFMIIELNQ